MTTTTTITAQQILDLGGREWTGRNGQRRIYLNNWHELAGLEITRYKSSGSISSAKLNGELISNRKAGMLMAARVWFDVKAGELRHTIRQVAEDARIEYAADVLIDNLTEAIRRAGARELTAAQAAQELGVSIRTVRRWAATGKITARKNDRGHWIITL